MTVTALGFTRVADMLGIEQVQPLWFLVVSCGI